MDDEATQRDAAQREAIRRRYGEAVLGIGQSLRAVYDREDEVLESDLTRLMMILSHVPRQGH